MLLRALSRDLLVMALSLSIHECAHAWVALRRGDDAAEREGRVSSSPATHIDPLGTLIVPALNIISSGVGFLGWARPTPVSPERFRPGVSGRTGMALVAAAGPFSNLLMGVVALSVFAILNRG